VVVPAYCVCLGVVVVGVVVWVVCSYCLCGVGDRVYGVVG
jgi:hypothetical protein